jgi:imidazole glycerol-phosphate synthase subunit HisH
MPNKSDQKIVIIDYGIGNLRSVLNKFKRLNIPAEISSNPKEIKKADKLILPGVGHFSNGVKKIKEYRFWDILNQKVIEDKVPILGICLGMQLFAKHSEEGNSEGLGWLDAEAKRFKIEDKFKWKVPHIGWNSIKQHKKSILFKNVKKDSLFYFVHSYHIVCKNKNDVLTTTIYDYEFVSAVEKGNIYGTQFHPEKSHDWGAKILENFARV